MSDKELLELAAKAAGIDYPSGIDARFAPGWEPLTDDGDALRLAVKLGMSVSVEPYRVWVGAVVDYDIVEEYGDVYAATRRAIVRAAAEIGRNMK